MADACAGCVNLCIKNAKAQFSAGVAGLGRSTSSDQFRRPDEEEARKLTLYGKKL